MKPVPGASAVPLAEAVQATLGYFQDRGIDVIGVNDLKLHSSFLEEDLSASVSVSDPIPSLVNDMTANWMDSLNWPSPLKSRIDFLIKTATDREPMTVAQRAALISTKCSQRLLPVIAVFDTSQVEGVFPAMPSVRLMAGGPEWWKWSYFRKGRERKLFSEVSVDRLAVVTTKVVSTLHSNLAGKLNCQAEYPNGIAIQWDRIGKEPEMHMHLNGLRRLFHLGGMEGPNRGRAEHNK